ncbi:MAG: 1-phosphofructokinase [Lachnospiraceae bacterium]|nr:1-phosphofructokinase [Lachnospiraceae bacterium]
MVYTVTFNPSLDYVMNLNEFNQGKVNRTQSEKINVGGKGINVSIVLNNLGVENTALGFVAGFTGIEIEERLKHIGCNTEFIHLKDGFSRINVKIKTETESEINGTGPLISSDALNDLYKILNRINEDDILVLAGSIPKSLPDSIYMDILKRFEGKNIKTVVDATGKLLVNVLKYRPFLIKPNNHEIEEIFGVTVDSEEKIIHYGRELINMGAKNVLVSRGKDGAILFTDDGRVLSCKAPDGKVIDTVGAGDSMVAGFIVGYLEKKDYDYALKMGIATGSASAFSKELATREEVERLITKTFGKLY